ncbi:transcriptional initiation protein Tat [Enterovibrio norvegicus]|uniref:Formate dehydrogenase region TAT target n=1 Tax=Enterovibrio norvegicus DSM 15893 TaxID=1121869 RepID=A0A1I5RK66_9GAMM|nr:twin-arginine translocation signal domain-containing protein [Enterovibrio norvegicus]MCC4797997.1 twin-arginine translocation signal domain-containing protein [Enterovibrio norvegicus]OEF60382.1 transcriptional initiation protein Tat [Enterovibrio norvegicus]PMI34756.1 transcriptional initiation protein Tat [Enterovibrio norvegicus]PMN44963.1 transcriptional initiation protein Tat [Enterovibrio norvegicus]SFP58727.1 formate dehydrogenase region TAT target [Enterovibrio norvegicus DSM 15893
MSENKKDSAQPNEKRREFLKGLGVAAAASAAASVVSTSAQADVDVVSPEETPKSGYRETQHIRDYYDSL